MPDKGKDKYPELKEDFFGVGAVRFADATASGGSTGNTGSCGVNVSCILCCCVGNSGGADNKKVQLKV